MFTWETINRREDGKIKLLYRHERLFVEGVITPGMKVLDVGGWGVLASRIIEEGSECLILDNFTEDQYFPDRVLSLPHVRADILDIESVDELRPDFFDVVTCFEMLEHCTDQQMAISNMVKLLKPGGMLVGTFPIPGFCHVEGEVDIRWLTRVQLGFMLTTQDLVNVKVEPTASVNLEDEPCSLYFKGTKND